MGHLPRQWVVKGKYVLIMKKEEMRICDNMDEKCLDNF